MSLYHNLSLPIDNQLATKLFLYENAISSVAMNGEKKHIYVAK